MKDTTYTFSMITVVPEIQFTTRDMKLLCIDNCSVPFSQNADNHRCCFSSQESADSPEERPCNVGYRVPSSARVGTWGSGGRRSLGVIDKQQTKEPSAAALSNGGWCQDP